MLGLGLMDDVTITDSHGSLIEVGATVRAAEGLFEPDPGEGTVLAISDFEGDVDDDTGRSITHEPRITVRWADGSTEEFATFEWVHTPASYDEGGCPVDYDHEGICEELQVLTKAGER